MLFGQFGYNSNETLFTLETEASFSGKIALSWSTLLFYVEADSAQNWEAEIKAELF